MPLKQAPPNMLYKVWNDCDGGIITTELVLVASVLTATLLTGMGSLRTHLQSEFTDLGNNIQNASRLATAPAATPQPKAVETPGTAVAGDVEWFLAD